MGFVWIIYALALFVGGGACFYTALAALVRMDEMDQARTETPQTVSGAVPPPEPAPRLTRLGRPVRQIQIT